MQSKHPEIAVEVLSNRSKTGPSMGGFITVEETFVTNTSGVVQTAGGKPFTVHSAGDNKLGVKLRVRWPFATGDGDREDLLTVMLTGENALALIKQIRDEIRLSDATDS